MTVKENEIVTRLFLTYRETSEIIEMKLVKESTFFKNSNRLNELK